MLALAFACGTVGIDGAIVRVEADASPGVPGFQIIGLPDRALNEARDRVRAAIVNSGFPFPAGRLLVNLAPAEMRKEGPAFDLPIALALLANDEQVPREPLRDVVAAGELALDGSLRPVPGVLAMALAARAAGFTRVLVPEANRDEATLVGGIEAFAVPTLADAIAAVLGHGARFRHRGRPVPATPDPALASGDFRDVRGQAMAKRALEIAAAGGHNLVLAGPPGCGKSMLARRLPSILPAMSAAEALEVTKVYSIAGLLGTPPAVVATRPFRSPHHTLSRAALVGGGSVPRPGEITLAQHGVLYLDELGEFSRATLEVLRQPLEEGTVTIARASGTVTYPARFTLVASMNPCPCGYRGTRGAECRCDDVTVQKYVGKLSGPLLDRIDLHVAVARLGPEELAATPDGASSAEIRVRVEAARAVARSRLEPLGLETNAQIPAAQVRRVCAYDEESAHLVARAVRDGGLSARAYDRIARVARTIADLAPSDAIRREHVAEALGYRALTDGRRVAA